MAATKKRAAKAAEETVKDTVKDTVEKPEEKAKKPARKKTPAKAALNAGICIQFAGKSYTNEELLQIAKDVWQYDLKREEQDLQSVELYVKPEESTVYYVFNATVEGSFGI